MRSLCATYYGLRATSCWLLVVSYFVAPERCPSGLRGTLGKRVYFIVPRVRLSLIYEAGRPANAGRIQYLRNNMFYVYILRSLKDDKLYIGMTSDLERRVKEHESKKVKSTKHRLPVKLICYEAYLHKKEAERRERYLKSSDGRKDLRKRLGISLNKVRKDARVA